MKTTKKQFTVYMVCAFGIAYILQVIASIFANSGKQEYFTVFMSGIMFVPFLSVLIARIPLKGMGWRPHLKGKIRYIFIALWTPAILSILGALLFYGIFPNAFDGEMETLKAMGIEEALAEQGMTISMYFAVNTVLSVTFAPFMNMFVALGEEVGWRGAMYPYLKEKLGVIKGRILGGILWGVWHWPVMILAGYEYGKTYFGAPVLGPVVFCIATAAMGILHDFLYDRTKCIWIPALFHGAVNAFTIFAYLLKPEYQSYMILGPVYIGIISMIPLVITAVILSVKESKQN